MARHQNPAHPQPQQQQQSGGGHNQSSGKKGLWAAILAIPIIGPLIDAISKDYSKFFGIDISTVISLADDEIHAWASEAAKAASRKVKKDSFFRGWFLRRGSAAVINQIGKLARTVENEQVAGGIEKLADFLDSFRQEFFGSKEAADAYESGQELGTETRKRIDKVKATAFAEHERQRRKAASPVEEKIAHLRAMQETTHLLEQEQLMTQGLPKPPKPPEPPKTPKTPLKQRIKETLQPLDDRGTLEPLNQGLRDLRDWLKK